MDPLSATGYLVRAVDIVYYSLSRIAPEPLYAILEIISLRGLWSSFRELCKQYGAFNAILLLFIFPNAKHVVERINLHLLKTENQEEAKNVKKSLSEECTMLAVAAAIVAQVAITGLSLNDISSVHWTAKAFFIASLVTGALSVFYACLIQQKLSSLFSADDMRAWLSQPGDNTARQTVDGKISSLVLQWKIWGLEPPPSFDHALKELEHKIKTYRDNHHLKTTSFYAALMIKIPVILLNYAVAAFLVGLGIYLGCVATSGLNGPSSKTDSMAVLIFYCLVTALGLLLYGVPSVLKMMEYVHVRRWETILKRGQRIRRHQDSYRGIESSGRGVNRPHQSQEEPQTNVDATSGGGEVPQASSPYGHDPVEGSHVEQQNLGMDRRPTEPVIPNASPVGEGIGGEGGTLMSALQASIAAHEQALVALRMLQSEYRERGFAPGPRSSG